MKIKWPQLCYWVLALVIVGFLVFRFTDKATPVPAPVVVVAPVPQPAKAIAPEPKQVHRDVRRHVPVYHRVRSDGTVDGTIDCAKVPSIAHQYSPDVVAQYAKEYGYTDAQVKQLRVCLQ